MTQTGQDDDVVALAREGNLIAAIKLYRTRTGLGLAEAKAAVEAMMREPAPRPSASANASRADDPVFQMKLDGLLRAGRKIEAIREYRQRNGCGLKDAKDAVDRLAVERGIVAMNVPWWRRFF